MNINLLSRILIAAALVSLVAFALFQAPAVLADPVNGFRTVIESLLRSVPLYREGLPGIPTFGIESAGV